MYIKESRLKVQKVDSNIKIKWGLCAHMYACTYLCLHVRTCPHIHTISKYTSCITNIWKPLYSKLANTFHKSKWYESHWYYLHLKVPTSFIVYVCLPLLWYSFIPLTDMFHCVLDCSIYTQYCSIKNSCILVNFWLQNTLWSHFLNIQVTLDTLFFQILTSRLSA